MKRFLSIIIFVAVATSCYSKAYFAGKKEMIQKAECIAVVNITTIQKADKKGEPFTYHQKATGTIERCLKGDIEGEIEIYGMESFICAQCRYSEGRFLLFLRENGGLLTGSNWQLGIRPITEDMVPWFNEGESRFETKSMPLDDVISSIIEIIEEQQRFSQNTVYSQMSYDGSELTILRDAVINESDYKELADANGFMHLKNLTIHNNQSLTDSTIKQFRKAPIGKLSLSGDSFSNEGLMELLKSLPNLMSLNLSSTKLSDEGLAMLQGEHLEQLVIYNTKITDQGLSHITGLPQLSHLNLGGKNLTNKGYVHLKQLHQLRELFTGYDGVTEETFTYLQTLPIEKLSLYDVAVSKSALQTLGDIKTLSHLDLARCRVESGGIEEFKLQLPDVHVTRR